MKYPLPLTLGLVLLAPGAPGANKPQNEPPQIPPALLQTERTKIVTGGTYRDAAGKEHPWHVTAAHSLLWDGAAFLPVGVTFTPQSWAPGAAADAWAADQKALDDLKAHGILDVCLSAGKSGLTHVAPTQVQKTLDYLDAGGLRYGIEIADFPKDPLIGYVIKPSVYRDASPPVSGPARFSHIPGIADAVYMLVSRHDGEIDEKGRAQIQGQDTAIVNVKSAGPDDVLLLYPQRLFFDGSPESHLPDLWQGYDEYRDRLLAFFRRINLGPGFRFFRDPLTDGIGLQGEVENLIPTTQGFQLDFQAWLDRKYGHSVDDLNRGWGIADRSTGSAVPDFATGARCIPLWFGTRGVPAIFDPTTQATYAVTNKPRILSHFWEDIAQFRVESTRGYMNAIADVLKKGVADVPVVYDWTGHNALFSNDRTRGGYDGLNLTPGPNESIASGAYVYGQAEESPKTSWLLAGKAGEAVKSSGDLFGDWDALKGIGVRGFFLSLGTSTPGENALDWLNSFAAGTQLSAAALADSKPRILWYPAGANLGLGVRQLSDGVWWLPSYQPGERVMLGPTMQGYTLPDQDGRLPTYVVWSPDGTAHTARFAFPKDSQPLITDAAGAMLKFDKKGDTWTIPIGAEPTLIRRVRGLPLPLDAADAAAREAKRLLGLAESQGINIQKYKDQIFYALYSIPDEPGNTDIRFSLLSRVIISLTDVLRPFAWIEGEGANKTTFDALVPDPQSSGGSYLSVDTAQEPPLAAAGEQGGYRADYSFTVTAPGRYTLWMAGSPLGGRDVSPFAYSVDDGLRTEVRGAPAVGGTYAGKFTWSSLGDVTLSRGGQHTLSLVILGHRPADDHYTLAVDVLCLDRAPFHPDGTRPPLIDVPLPPPATDTGKKRK